MNHTTIDILLSRDKNMKEIVEEKEAVDRKRTMIQRCDIKKKYIYNKVQYIVATKTI